ncbi:MAG: hypothetical protein A2Y25_11375 [Candidatus Melainabacteria bacterium GWF2_37_15]|nr:MAG: hypothetical protein A2Y25_11375 [Candidatus Melainabacteria bacterium GWF2_37_15]
MLNNYSNFNLTLIRNQNISFDGIRDSAEKRLLYDPSTKITPIPPDANIEKISIPTANNGEIKCYYRAPKPGMPTVMFCHGIKYNASYFVGEMPEFLINKDSEKGYGLLITDYRGFGESTPINPSEKTIYEDAHSAIKFLNKNKITPDNIVIWGMSMGGGVASELAIKYNFKGVILDSTFTTMGDAVNKHCEKIPGHRHIGKFLQSKFENIKKMKDIKVPVLILHTKTDNVVPLDMAYRNYEALKNSGNSNVTMFLNEKGDHNDMKWKAQAISEFLSKL